MALKKLNNKFKFSVTHRLLLNSFKSERTLTIKRGKEKNVRHELTTGTKGKQQIGQTQLH